MTFFLEEFLDTRILFDGLCRSFRRFWIFFVLFKTTVVFQGSKYDIVALVKTFECMILHFFFLRIIVFVSFVDSKQVFGESPDIDYPYA